MSAIVVDYSVASKKMYPPPHNPFPKTKPGLIVVIAPNLLEQLKKKKLGRSRIDFFNSHSFQSQIKKMYPLFYDYRKKIVYLLPRKYNNFPVVLSALFAGFDQDAVIKVAIPFDKKRAIDQFLANGFGEPRITNNKLILCRENKPLSKIDHVSAKHRVTDVLSHSNKKVCSINVQITKKALKFLKKASKIGITINKNGKKSQKELTGELYVGKIVKKGGKIVHLIELDHGSVSSGEEEEVDVEGTRYNFHSHPKEAYVRHSVDKAWPSQTDYLGYLYLGNDTILHCVATLEGLYALSFGSYWVNNLKNVSTSFVENNYHIDHKEHYTPQEYCRKICAIKYKNHPIFRVQFFPWKSAGRIFSVNYAKTNETCVAV